MYRSSNKKLPVRVSVSVGTVWKSQIFIYSSPVWPHASQINRILLYYFFFFTLMYSSF
jgi:hypothetical protein